MPNGRCESGSRPPGPSTAAHTKALCEHNQVAANHLLQLLHLSHFGTQRYKTTIHKAVRSVCVYPLPIESEKDALALDGVGKFLAREIMRAFGAVVTTCPETAAVIAETSGRDPLYKPEHGRGPWGVMLALRFLNGRGTKEDVTGCITTHNIQVPSPSLPCD
jgi:hypothetical protein